MDRHRRSSSFTGLSTVSVLEESVPVPAAPADRGGDALLTASVIFTTRVASRTSGTVIAAVSTADRPATEVEVAYPATTCR